VQFFHNAVARRQLIRYQSRWQGCFELSLLVNCFLEKIEPDVPVNRTFYEQTFNELIYESTNGISKASLFASIVTIGIAALGLYALAFYTSQRRTKEVGVRKVLGATSISIVGLLTWDFVKPVLFGCVIASILGYFATTYFFAQFSSRPTMSVSVYLAVALVTVVIAILTVSIQCFRTATSDPIGSLRYE
jgi:putative ABC transport system permease protein